MYFKSESNNKSSVNILNLKKISVLIIFFVWLFGVGICSNFTCSAVLCRRSSYFVFQTSTYENCYLLEAVWLAKYRYNMWKDNMSEDVSRETIGKNAD